MELAEQFAEGQEPPAAGELLASLESELPVRDFTAAVRRLGVAPAWHQAHLQSVQQVVTDWATRHGIELDLSIEPPSEVRAGSRAAKVSRHPYVQIRICIV